MFLHKTTFHAIRNQLLYDKSIFVVCGKKNKKQHVGAQATATILPDTQNRLDRNGPHLFSIKTLQPFQPQVLPASLLHAPNKIPLQNLTASIKVKARVTQKGQYLGANRTAGCRYALKDSAYRRTLHMAAHQTVLC